MSIKNTQIARGAAALFALSTGMSLIQSAWAADDETLVASVTVSGGRPTSLPTQIPTTIEGMSGEQIAQSINAADAEDALQPVKRRQSGGVFLFKIGHDVVLDDGQVKLLSQTKDSVGVCHGKRRACRVVCRRVGDV